MCRSTKVGVVSVHTGEWEREGGTGKTGSREISIVKVLKAMEKKNI